MSDYHKALRKLNPCKDSVKWAKPYPALQAAWDACIRPDWMLWLVGMTHTHQTECVQIAYEIADRSVRVDAVVALRAAADAYLDETRRSPLLDHAANLEALPRIDSINAARAASNASWAARCAAEAASDAAWAASAAAGDARYAASAAGDTAGAAGNAARAASNAAWAARAAAGNAARAAGDARCAAGYAARAARNAAGDARCAAWDASYAISCDIIRRHIPRVDAIEAALNGGGK